MNKVENCFIPLSSGRVTGSKLSKETVLEIAPWTVELHGSLRTGLSFFIDKELDKELIENFRLGKI